MTRSTLLTLLGVVLVSTPALAVEPDRATFVTERTTLRSAGLGAGLEGDASGALEADGSSFGLVFGGDAAVGIDHILPDFSLAAHDDEKPYALALGRYTQFGAGGHARGSLVVGGDNNDVRPLTLDYGARFELGLATVRLRETYQRPTRFDDLYWRSHDDLLTTEASASVPGVLTAYTEGAVVSIAPLAAQYRAVYDGSGYFARSDAVLAADVELAASLGRYDWEEKDITLESVVIRWSEWGIPGEPVSGGSTFPRTESDIRQYQHAYAVEFDLLRFRGLDVPESKFVLDAGGGLKSLCPAYGHDLEEPDTLYARTCKTRVSGRIYFRTHGFVADWERISAESAGESGWGLDVRTFERLRPNGLVADFGYAATGTGRYHLGEGLRLDGRAQIAWSETAFVSEVAPADLDPYAGTSDRLGRFDLRLSWTPVEGLAATLSSWMEHSDRFDPDSHPASGETRTSYGARAGLRFEY